MIQILQGDCRDVLKTLPDESVHCVVTSPPYWGLRDYGTAKWDGGDPACDHQVPLGRKGGNAVGTKQTTNPGSYTYREWHVCGKCGAKRVDPQLGLEKTPEEYVAKMVAVFREVRRVLREDGTAWVNMGDSYASQGGPIKEGGGINDILGGKPEWQDYNRSRTAPSGLKPKDLCGIPWRLAFALQADGWWLRQDIIWHKPNPMPESVTDRCTKAHEYLFLLTKSARYFFDAEAIKEPSQDAHDRLYADGFKTTWTAKLKGNLPTGRIEDDGGKQYGCPESGRNRRSVWTINSEPYPESHFATFPTALVKPCILAGTSAKGCCPKCGAPWERVVDTSYSNWAYGNSNGKRKGDIPDERMSFASGKRCEKSTTTTGWRPTCECGETDTIPATVLDPFGGSGTVGQVSLELGRKAILIELNPDYVKLAEKRTNVTPGLQLA